MIDIIDKTSQQVGMDRPAVGGQLARQEAIEQIWNSWIIYPLAAWVLRTATQAWLVFGRNPISEAEIRREMERQAGSTDSSRAPVP